MADDRNGLEKLAYETALSALKSQEDELNQLRTRTGTLLAAGSLTASFFGAQSLSRSGTGPWSGLAIVAFVFSTLPCLYLLALKSGLVFSLSGSGVYQELKAKKDDMAGVYTDLTLWLQAFWDGNQEKIDQLGRYF